MVANFIIIIVFIVILYYASTNENTQFAATASAIRQIWSGNCRLSCRQSEHSGISGLSGLPEAPCQAGTSRDECVCDSCPCALIENFLRTCQPATNVYGNVTDTLLYCYYNILKSISEAYGYVTRVLECHTSCQRQAKVLGTKEYNSSENFSFDQDNEGKTDKKPPKSIRPSLDISKTTIAPKKSSISFKEPVKFDNTSEGDSDESIKAMKRKVSDQTLKPADETSGSVSPRSYCSKCIEKGKTCVSECPRAKKKK